MNRSIRLSVLLALLVAWFTPTQFALASTIAGARASAAADCQEEDNPKKCLAELAKESSDSEDESESESEDESSDQSDDNGSSDDESEDESEDDSGSNGGSGTLGGKPIKGKDKDKDHSIPARIIKSGGSSDGNKPSNNKPGKRPGPSVTPEPEQLVIGTDITLARAALLRTAASAAGSSATGNDDYLPRVGGIMNHTARMPGAGTAIAAGLAIQAAQVRELRDAIVPVEMTGDERHSEDSLAQALNSADFSDPAEEFMAKAGFGATVLGAGAVALAASALRNRRKLKLEQDADYDYDSAK